MTDDVPKRKRGRPKRIRYDEPGELREVLGELNEVSFELQRSANFGKPYCETDPYATARVCFQPDITSDDSTEPQANPSRRFKRFWATLTNAQKQALRMVYLNNPDRLRKVEVAKKLGIRVDTLQERIDYAFKKFLKFHPLVFSTLGDG